MRRCEVDSMSVCDCICLELFCQYVFMINIIIVFTFVFMSLVQSNLALKTTRVKRFTFIFISSVQSNLSLRPHVLRDCPLRPQKRLFHCNSPVFKTTTFLLTLERSPKIGLIVYIVWMWNNLNTYTARPVCWSGWISDSYCSLKPLCSGMGEVVPALTSPTLLPPSPRTVLSLSCFKVL